MVSKIDKQKAIEKISADPIFSTGDFYKQILQYLLKCHFENYIPTELDIAIHIFGKKKDFDPTTDTIVRVYLYRIRQKLKNYYADSGKNDPVRVSIPKGHYYIKFKSAEELEINNAVEIKSSHRFQIVTAAFAILFIVAIILFISNLQMRRQLTKRFNILNSSFIWNDFLNKNYRTYFVIGDLFAFYQYQKQYDRTWLIRDDQINSEAELEQFIEKYNIDKNDIDLLNWDIIPKSSSINLSRILPLFYPNEDLLQIKLTSELTWKDIETRNIIYIGHYHNLNILNPIFPTHYLKADNHAVDGITHFKIDVKTHEIDTSYYAEIYFDGESASDRDYSVIARVAGPNSNTFLFITSFSAMGRLKTVELITKPDLLNKLEKDIISIQGKPLKYFLLLIEIIGYKETGLDMKIKHVFELPDYFVLNE